MAAWLFYHGGCANRQPATSVMQPRGEEAKSQPGALLWRAPDIQPARNKEEKLKPPWLGDLCTSGVHARRPAYKKQIRKNLPYAVEVMAVLVMGTCTSTWDIETCRNHREEMELCLRNQ